LAVVVAQLAFGFVVALCDHCTKRTIDTRCGCELVHFAMDLGDALLRVVSCRVAKAYIEAWNRWLAVNRPVYRTFCWSI